jgi:hypothetical protein
MFFSDDTFTSRRIVPTLHTLAVPQRLRMMALHIRRGFVAVNAATVLAMVELGLILADALATPMAGQGRGGQREYALHDADDDAGCAASVSFEVELSL